jgi:hypothetical protein
MRAASEDLPDGGREIAERTARIPSLSAADTRVVLLIGIPAEVPPTGLCAVLVERGHWCGAV